MDATNESDDHENCRKHSKKAFDWLELTLVRTRNQRKNQQKDQKSGTVLSSILAGVARSIDGRETGVFEIIELIAYLYAQLVGDAPDKSKAIHATGHVLDKMASAFERSGGSLSEDFLEEVKKSFTLAETANYILKDAKQFIDKDGTAIWANAFANYLYYCDACDCLHLMLKMRDTKRKLGVLFSMNRVEDLRRLIAELQKVLAVFERPDGEASIIEEIKRDGYGYWSIYHDQDPNDDTTYPRSNG